MSFGSSAPGSLGVEEELFLVDAETLDTVPLASEIVAQHGPRLKHELFACVVELTTPICESPGQVLRELHRLRRQSAALAAPLGATILAAGAHPTARGDGQEITPKPVYRSVADQLGAGVARQLVCGLHVHVAVGSREECLAALEGVLPSLPTVLALSANSPFLEGVETGLRSSRAERLAELPSGGAPPIFLSWAGWERATAGLDYRRLHWDVRPHPLYGTLEVRIADQQTDVRRSAAFAALVQALVRAVLARGPHRPYDREGYSGRRRAASAEPPDTTRLAALVEPVARKLGSWDLVDHLLRARPEAERQLEVGLPAVVRDLAERSLA